MTPNSSHRRIALSAAALAASLLIAGCAASAPNPDAEQGAAADGLRPVTLMLNWTPNAHHAGIYYAHEHGLYEAAGLDVEILEPGDGIGADASVAQGRADFGISQAESVLPARAAGMDLEAVATLLPVNDSVLMGLAGSGLTADPGSLAGLTYGGYGGALETEIISALAECGGADAAAVEFVEIGNVDYLSGLAQQRFDVTWVFGGWDALRAQAERDDVSLIALADQQACIPNWYTPVIIGNAKAMTEDPDLAESFLAATSAGYDAVVADPSAGAAAMLAAVPELDEGLIAAAVEYYAPRFAPDGRFGAMESDIWQRFTEFLVRANMLDDATALDGAWTNDYLPAA